MNCLKKVPKSKCHDQRKALYTIEKSTTTHVKMRIEFNHLASFKVQKLQNGETSPRRKIISREFRIAQHLLRQYKSGHFWHLG